MLFKKVSAEKKYTHASPETLLVSISVINDVTVAINKVNLKIQVSISFYIYIPIYLY